MKAQPRRRSAKTLAFAALVLLASVSVFAQTPEPAPSPTVASTPELVRLGVSVIDSKNRFVEDVKREDVRLFEDGVEQTVSYFEKESSPASYGFVVDNTGSFRRRIHLAITSAKFMAAHNQTGDETFVMRFVDRAHIQLLQELTPNTGSVQRALEEMYAEGGQTALIDALYLSADYLLKNSKAADGKPRRRALVLITDGEDRRSSYKQDELLALLRESDIQIFCIGLVKDLDGGRGFNSGGSKRDKAEGLLERLASETGGRVFYPDDVKELEDAAEEIVKNLRAHYVVGYTPTATPSVKPFRKVEIKLAETKGKEKRRAVHRQSYAVAGRGNSEGKKKGGQ